MRILVTGASGFLGCHLTSALTASGHQVRAYIRSPEKLERAMAPFPEQPDEVFVGDVTDSHAVSAAISGCEAVYHAANVYSYDPRRSEEMTHVNVTGSENVLGAAVEAGCDPVVYVSTAQVSWPKPNAVDEEPPLAPLGGMPYSDSKKRAEKFARDLQDRGAPVVTTYPGAILGRHDPGPGELITLLRTALVPTAPFRIDGGFPACDVDWVTELHVALLERGRGPRRVTCSGPYIPWEEWFDLARNLTGRPIRNRVPSTDWMLRGMGALMDTLQKIVPTRLPFGREPGWILLNSYGYPDEEAQDLAGPWPPLEDSLSTAVRWAVAAGHITPEQAGDLAPATA